MDSMKRVLFLAAALPLLSACDPLTKEFEARDLCHEGLDYLACCQKALAKPVLTPSDIEKLKDDLELTSMVFRIGLRNQSLSLIRPDSARYRRALREAERLMLNPKLNPPSNP
jgi:hypothetical protein